MSMADENTAILVPLAASIAAALKAAEALCPDRKALADVIINEFIKLTSVSLTGMTSMALKVGASQVVEGSFVVTLQFAGLAVSATCLISIPGTPVGSAAVVCPEFSASFDVHYARTADGTWTATASAPVLSGLQPTSTLPGYVLILPVTCDGLTNAVAGALSVVAQPFLAIVVPALPPSSRISR
jgi:hypothetical protein